MSYKQLTSMQRYHIKLSLQKGVSKKEIAADIEVQLFPGKDSVTSSN